MPLHSWRHAEVSLLLSELVQCLVVPTLLLPEGGEASAPAAPCLASRRAVLLSLFPRLCEVMLQGMSLAASSPQLVVLLRRAVQAALQELHFAPVVK